MSNLARPLAGLGMVVALLVILAVSIGLFAGKFTETVPVTVISDRAGLVMYPNAKVKMNGAPVGKVASIDHLPGGGAALNLAIDPDAVSAIPANVGAEITSSTVFGSKFVELVAPDQPSSQNIKAGTRIQGGDKVTVEQAKIIRRWGTTKGLGELATGPVSESVLDPAGMVETHRLGVVLTIACDADAWKAHL